jgi:hypothetical protein
MLARTSMAVAGVTGVGITGVCVAGVSVTRMSSALVTGVSSMRQAADRHDAKSHCASGERDYI